MIEAIRLDISLAAAITFCCKLQSGHWAVTDGALVEGLATAWIICCTDSSATAEAGPILMKLIVSVL